MIANMLFANERRYWVMLCSTVRNLVTTLRENIARSVFVSVHISHFRFPYMGFVGVLHFCFGCIAHFPLSVRTVSIRFFIIDRQM